MYNLRQSVDQLRLTKLFHVLLRARASLSLEGPKTTFMDHVRVNAHSPHTVLDSFAFNACWGLCVSLDKTLTGEFHFGYHLLQGAKWKMAPIYVKPWFSYVHVIPPLDDSLN